MPQPSLQSRRTFFAVLFATLGILGILVGGITWWLRGRLRAEVLQREAEAIHAVALMEISAAQSRAPELPTGDSVPALFTAVLESSRLRGVLAVQLFDACGALLRALPDAGDGTTPRPWWSPALEQSLARFQPRGSLEEIFGASVGPGEEPTRVPLLEIVVPLRPNPKSARLLGTARYWVEGEPVAAEFARMDQGLFWQAGLAYCGGATLIALVLAWAFARLSEASRRLLEQSADLSRANQELDFAAKTSAIGAISAHLIHGLKNPLAGLEGFVSDPALADETQRGEAWRTAVETARRLRALVQEVTTVLRAEADDQADYQVPVAELVDAAEGRASVAADAAGVQLSSRVPKDVSVVARNANLTRLVLANLLANAIEASPRGARVSLVVQVVDQRIDFLVEDAGGGMPESVRVSLFRPVKSAKRNGGGVGLAISHQLARHMGGTLELVRSDASGTVFRLGVPRLNVPTTAK